VQQLLAAARARFAVVVSAAAAPPRIAGDSCLAAPVGPPPLADSVAFVVAVAEPAVEAAFGAALFVPVVTFSFSFQY